MNFVKEYPRRWAKHEKDLDTFSEWTKSVRCMLDSRIMRFKRSMKTIYASICIN